MKNIIHFLNHLDMDNPKDIEWIVTTYTEWLRLNKDYSDIEILPSKTFTQTFIAHNIYEEFTVYNTWDFIRDVKQELNNLKTHIFTVKFIAEKFWEDKIGEYNQIKV